MERTYEKRCDLGTTQDVVIPIVPGEVTGLRVNNIKSNELSLTWNEMGEATGIVCIVQIITGMISAF